MVTFADGPAKGASLCLSRAPIFLRVTHDGKGTFDALNMLDDEAKPDEEIFAYVMKEHTGTAHVSRTVNGRRCGQWIVSAIYRLWKEQPGDETMRNNSLWADWTETQRQHPEVLAITKKLN